MNLRKMGVVFFVLVFVFSMGIRTNFAAEKEIAIGCVVSLTGYLSEQAQNMAEGLEFAAEDLNARGGLLGRKVKVHVRDDEMKPPVGARRFEDLVKNQGIVMHSGVVHGAVAMSIQQINKQIGTVLFQSNITPDYQHPKNMQPNLFFAGSTLEAFGLAGGEYAAQNLGKKAFLLYPDYSFGWSIRDAFMKSIPANGGEIIGSIAVPSGTTDFAPFLTQILAKKPDYVVFIVNGMMFVSSMKQAFSMGLKEKMKIVSTHASIEEVSGCGPEVIKDVILVSDYFWNVPTESNKKFVEKFQKKYGNDKAPSMRHYYQYTALNMWADVVKKVGTVEPKAVAAALPGFKGDYGKGEVEIRKTGDHTTIQPVIIVRGKGPQEMKDKLDTQEVLKMMRGEKYFYSAKEKGW
jgi:branched-chain amino acid transport system substrate-binding protein